MVLSVFQIFSVVDPAKKKKKHLFFLTFFCNLSLPLQK